MPIMEGYWLYPSSTASAAARRMSSGPGPSGKPWPRLMALLSRASCDMASKIVTGRSANTLFMEVMGRSVAGFRRQSGSLPGQHSPRKMIVIGKAGGLRGERCRHGSLARATREHHLLAVGIGNAVWVEARQRNHDRARIGFHSNFVRLSDVNQKVASLGHAPRNIFRRQIVNLLSLVRHPIPPATARRKPPTSPFAT